MAALDLDITEDLANAREILNPAKMAIFADGNASQGSIDDAIKALEPRDAAIAALAVFGHSNSEFEVLVKRATGQDLSAIYDHLAQNAPRLVDHPLIGRFADKLGKRIRDRLEEEQNRKVEKKGRQGYQSLLYHDVDSVRTSIRYLSVNEPPRLIPVTRIEVICDPEDQSIVMDLRILDLIFVANSMLDTLDETLANARAISEGKLLQAGEFKGLSERVAELAAAFDQLRKTADKLVAAATEND